MAGRPALSLTEGQPGAPPRIALSLVHPRGRIDIPVRDVLNIEARAEETFFFPDTWTSQTHRRPHVRLEFAPYIGTRIYRLTSQIVDDALAVVVCGKVICRPVVREPLGLRDRLNISVNDMDEACALVAKLREACIMPDLRLV